MRHRGYRLLSLGGGYLWLDVDCERGNVGLQTSAGSGQRAREMDESLSSGGHIGQRSIVGGCGEVARSKIEVPRSGGDSASSLVYSRADTHKISPVVCG